MTDDRLRRLAEFAASPLGEEIDLSLAWAKEHLGHGNVEIYLQPEDARPVAGGEYGGHPIRQSIGVPRGKALILDLVGCRYIRRGERP